MVINNTNYMNLTEKQVEDVTKKIVDEEIKKILGKIQSQLPQKLQTVRSEVFGNFKMIASTEILKTFIATYGSNFDVESLNASLTYDITKDLHPIITYDKNQLIFDSSLKKLKHQFNQNAQDTSKFYMTLERDELDTVEDEDIYYEDNAWDAALEEINVNILDDSDIFSPENAMMHQGGFASVDETYKKAINSALQAFHNKYNTYLKPILTKKYGIKL